MKEGINMIESVGNVMYQLSQNTWITHLWDTCITTSIIIVFLLALRPLFRRLPRNVMYVLWLVAACQIILPVSVSGIYNALPQAVS